MSGPIVRTGTTPEFWQNWDRIFGGSDSASKGANKKTAGKKKAGATKAAKADAKKTAKKGKKKAST